MTLLPLSEASLPIQIHVAFVALAVILTPVQLSLSRGSPAHKVIGRLWMGAMAATALSSFFISTIHMIGPFSPLHVLSVIALISIAIAYRAARRGDLQTHSKTLYSLVFLALFVTGLFTFFPGRIMYRVLFGE